MSHRNSGDPAWTTLWPAAERRVRRALVRKHVPDDVAAELLQETAARLVASHTEVRNVDELSAWAYTVASRLAVDSARRRRLVTVPLVEDIEGEADPADIAAARDDWERVVAAVRRLGPNDRAALLSVFEATPATRIEAVRWAVRRHRARVRLVAMLGQVGALVGVTWSGLRRLVRNRGPVVALAAAPIVAVVMLVSPFVRQQPEMPMSGTEAMPVVRLASGEAAAEAEAVAAPRHDAGEAASTVHDANGREGAPVTGRRPLITDTLPPGTTPGTAIPNSRTLTVNVAGVKAEIEVPVDVVTDAVLTPGEVPPIRR